MENQQQFEALGTPRAQWQGNLETFERPYGVDTVTYISDEVTAVCPVTGQPDWYIVRIQMLPRAVCIESKSLKLYLQSFRDQGHFCEAFAAIIAAQVLADANPNRVTVVVEQKSRGGVSIVAKAERFGIEKEREE